MISTFCAICNNNQNITELYPQTINFKNVNKKTFSARRTPDRMHYRFVKCTKCGLIFSNPILEREKIDRLYKESLFFYNEESSYIGKTYLHYLKQILGNKDKKNLKLLDIGCGDGFFLKEAKEFGINSVYGIEPSKPATGLADKDIKKIIKISILKPGIFKENFFDIICCFHTLDHITNPNAFLKQCFKMLKKGGKILFIVHNTDGLSVKLFGEKSAIFDIEHIYLFNAKSLTAIFKKNGFTPKQIFNIKNTYPLSYIVKMIPLPLVLKNFLLLALKKTGVGKIPLSLKPGNIGIEAVK